MSNAKSKKEKVRILIVEDELIIAEEIRNLLQDYGYIVSGIASNSASALEKIRNSAPDIILMDINLKSSTDGIEIAVSVKDQFRIPVIFLTSYSDTDSVERAKLAEPYGFIAKPFNSNELFGTIETALHRYSLEMKVKQSEERLRMITENVNDIIWTMNLKNEFTFVSASVSNLLGYTPEEMMTMPLLKMIAPGSIEFVQNKIAESFRTLAETKLFPDGVYEVEELHKDGHSVWMEMKVKGMYDADSNCTGIIGTSREITERKRYEDSLKKLAFNFSGLSGRELFENISRHLCESLNVDIAFVSEYSESNKKIKVTGGWRDGAGIGNLEYELKGSPCETVVGRSLCYYSENVAGMFPEDKLLSAEKIEAYCGYPLFDKTANPLGIIVLLCRNSIFDISIAESMLRIYADRISLEIQQNRIYAELKKSEEKFVKIADLTYDWEYWIGPEMELIYSSPSCLRITGYSRDEFFKRPGLLAEIVYPEDKLMLLEHLEGENLLGHDGMDFRIIHKNGEIRWINHVCYNIYDEAGNDLGRRSSNRDITERKSIELALAESSEKFESIFQLSPDMILITDLETSRYLDINEEFERVSGYGRNEILGKQNSDFSFWVNLEERETWLENLLDKKTLENFEADFKSRDGQIINCIVSSRLIQIGGRKINLSVLRDVTQLIKTRRELVKSEAQLSNAMKLSRTGAWEYDVAADEFTFTDEFYSLFRTTAEEQGSYKMKSSDYAKRFVHPDDKHLVAREIKNALEAEDSDFSRIIEHRIIFADGSEGYLKVQFRIVKDSRNNTVMTYGVNQDITEIKLTEKNLRESEAKFRRLFQESMDGILYTDPGGKIFAANPSACRILGYSEQEIIEGGRRLFVDPADERLPAALREREKKGFYFGELNYVRKNREKFPVELSSTVFRDENDRHRTIIIFRDITERKKAEEALRLNETKFRTIFNTLSEGVALNEMIFNEAGEMIDYRILDVNPAFHHLSDYRSMDVIGRLATDVYKMPSDFIKDFWIKHKDLNSNQLTEMKSPVSGKFYLISTSPFIENKFVTSFLDITDRKKAADEILSQKNMLNAIYESSPNILALIDREGRVVNINRQGRLFAGDRRDEILGLLVGEVFNCLNSFKSGVCGRTPDCADCPILTRVNRTFDTEKPVINAEGNMNFLFGRKKVNLHLQISTTKVNSLGGEFVLLTISDITERKLVENELRESEEKYRKFFEADLTADFRTTADGRLLECNDAFVKMFEYDSKEEALSIPVSSLYLSRRDRPKMIRRLKTEKRIELIEVRLLTKKGREIVVIENIFGEFDAKGRLKTTVGYLFDITNIRNAEKALVESERQYRALFTQMRSGFAYHEIILPDDGKPVDYKFLAVNPMFEKITGLKAENILGRRILEIIPDLEQLWIDNYAVVALTGKPVRFESFSAALGKYFFVSAYSTEKMRFAVIIDDITERKISEEKILQLSAAVEQSPASVVITDKKGNIEYVNRKFTELTGYKPKEVLGKNPRILKSGQTAKEEYRTLWETILSGNVWTGIFCNRKKNGNLFWESASISPIRNAGGEITHFVAIKEDITERIRIENELEIYRTKLEQLVALRTVELDSTNEKLIEEIRKEKELEMMLQQSLDKEKELSELKSKFISTTSHEFRTPLTSILSSAELIQRYGRRWPDEKLNYHTAKISNSINYLTQLLDDVLTISRAESGKIVFNPVETDLYNICEDVLEETRSNSNDRHEIVFEFMIRKRKYSLDPKLIRFMLVNLLSNAFKYSPKGGRVKLDISRSDRHLVISVSDEGIGIPPNEIKLLFEPFHRAANTIEISGTGLGLSIVKRAVDLHGGEIFVNSLLGKGSEFKIVLPIIK